MKKNNALRLAALLLVLATFTVCTLTGTLAKYIAEGEGSTSARAAVFSVKVGSTEIATGSKVTTLAVDLFKTLYEENITTAESAADVLQDDKGDYDLVIAPGTGGQFELQVNNDSEVPINVTITPADDSSTGALLAVMEFDGGNGWDTLAAAITAAATPATRVEAGASTTAKTIKWRWVFDKDTTDDPDANWDADDLADTAIGVAQKANLDTNVVTLKLNVLAVQVD
ncbi:MAG: hypothetical protein LBQ80_04400 [Clostridium sp.]|jgi:hypothetical protein|nr:hypothetical protein [Clostridium sp.]